MDVRREKERWGVDGDCQAKGHPMQEAFKGSTGRARIVYLNK